MEPSHVSNKDMIIAVMGATGAGKSTFIRSVTGKDIVVGHDLHSCTEDVLAVSCQHPQKRDRRVVFLDTPGFDDTTKTDAQVLENIANWLAQTYAAGIKLSGVLYLYRVSDNRMTGTSMKNLQMFRKLCGEDSLRNVVLVTTMWSTVDEARGAEREQQLQTKYWKTLIVGGAQVARYDDTTEGGWSIIGLLKDKEKVVLQLQHEIVDEKKSLIETSAGAAVEAAIAELAKKHMEELKALREEHKLAMERRDSEMLKAIKEEREEFERKLKETQDAMEQLKKPKGWLKDFANGLISTITLGMLPRVF